MQASAADFQEAKNVDSVGDELLPNTAFAGGPMKRGRRADDHLAHARDPRVLGEHGAAVLAGSTAKVRSVQFFDGKK